MGSLALGWRILRAEGARSFVERTLERFTEAQERRSYQPLGSARFAIDLLNLSPVPPSPRRGGVETQLAARRRAESRLRTFALLFPLNGRYRLEIHEPSHGEAAAVRKLAADLGPAPTISNQGFASLEPNALAAAVSAARTLTGARAVHVENPAGFELHSLADLLLSFELAVLSVHDHSLFCPRSDLFSPSLQAFCAESTDRARCALCLGASEGWQEARRAHAQRLLDQAAAVLFPSPHLLATHKRLFSVTEEDRWHSIAPAADVLPARLSSLEKQRLAYVGAARSAKGADLFAQLVARLAHHHPKLEFHAFGGGDPKTLVRFRALGVEVHGYYRTGTLPRRLAAAGIGLALLPSIVPESYNLAVDECARAGVPSVVFDLGAPAERVRRLGLGAVVPWSDSPLDDLLAAVEAHLEAPLPPPSQGALAALPHPLTTAAAQIELYRQLALARP